MVALNQQNARHFGEIRSGGSNLDDAEAFGPYDDLSGQLLDDIDHNLTSAANTAKGLAIANAVVTVALFAASGDPGAASTKGGGEARCVTGS